MRGRSAGERLVRLDFPRAKIQRFGAVAVVYSEYVLESEAAGQRTSLAGRATEILVRGGGGWSNPGWHLDSGS
jgi:ketosteroid isomerase-like protein